MTNTPKTVLITGASSGIGEATARLKTVVEEIHAAGGTAEFQALDVTDMADMQAFADFATQKFGRADVLVNNAGMMPLSPLHELKVEEWNRMIDVNIRGVLHGIAAVLPGMRAAKSGQIINVSSIGAHRVSPTAAVYCATKFAVNAISEGLRQENTDVRVTVVSPGAVESELAETISDPGTRELMREYRRVSISGEDIARAIAHAMDQPEGVNTSEIIVRPTAGAN